MRYRTEGKPAPGRLELVHGFLNTWSDELGIEDFQSPRSTEEWLREAGLWRGRKRMSDGEAETVREFRDALRRFVLHKRNPARIAEMQRFAARVGLGVTFRDDGGVELTALDDGVDHVLGTLIATIHISMVDGTWERFKCCELESCGWAFYDSTRNRSGRWCSMKTCGSRHKAREYLKRKARG